MTFIDKKVEACEINLNMKVVNEKSRNRPDEISKNNTTTENGKSFRNKTEYKPLNTGIKINEIKHRNNPVTITSNKTTDTKKSKLN
jgi:hypothetical protein